MEPPLVGAVAFGVKSGTEYYKYTVIRSKTSRCGFSRVAGCVGQQVCPVCYMRKYLGLRFGNKSWDLEAPLFLTGSGQVVTRYLLNQLIKSTVSEMGLDSSQYSSHSLRSGSATEAGIQGLCDYEIKALGGWRSSAYLLYVRQSLGSQVALSSRLAGGQGKHCS